MKCQHCEDGGLIFRDTGLPCAAGEMTYPDLLREMRPCPHCERGEQWAGEFEKALTEDAA